MAVLATQQVTILFLSEMKWARLKMSLKGEEGCIVALSRVTWRMGNPVMGCSDDKQPARWALVCPSLTPNSHTSPDQWSLRMLHLGPCHPPGTRQQTQPPLEFLMHQRPRSGQGGQAYSRDGKADGSGEAKWRWASTQPARYEGQA